MENAAGFRAHVARVTGGGRRPARWAHEKGRRLKEEGGEPPSGNTAGQTRIMRRPPLAVKSQFESARFLAMSAASSLTTASIRWAIRADAAQTNVPTVVVQFEFFEPSGEDYRV